MLIPASMTVASPNKTFALGTAIPLLQVRRPVVGLPKAAIQKATVVLAVLRSATRAAMIDSIQSSSVVEGLRNVDEERISMQ